MKGQRWVRVMTALAAVLALTACGTNESKPATSVLFVGDSFSSGGYAGVEPLQAFPCTTAAQLRWTCLLDAQGGTGYAADGRGLSATSRSYGERLPDTVARYPHPDVVVVSGGRNDDPSLVGPASAIYLTALTRAYPRARVLVLEPFWMGAVPPYVLTARTAVRASADVVGATWVPTADWLPDADLAGDLVHPTLTGQADIVRHLVPVLRAAAAEGAEGAD